MWTDMYLMSLHACSWRVISRANPKLQGNLSTPSAAQIQCTQTQNMLRLNQGVIYWKLKMNMTLLWINSNNSKENERRYDRNQNSLFESILDLVHHLGQYTDADQLWWQTAFYMIKRPHIFYCKIVDDLMHKNESHELFYTNLFTGSWWAHWICTGAICHNWNILINIVTPAHRIGSMYVPWLQRCQNNTDSKWMAREWYQDYTLIINTKGGWKLE